MDRVWFMFGKCFLFVGLCLLVKMILCFLIFSVGFFFGFECFFCFICFGEMGIGEECGVGIGVIWI